MPSTTIGDYLYVIFISIKNFCNDIYVTMIDISPLMMNNSTIEKKREAKKYYKAWDQMSYIR